MMSRRAAVYRPVGVKSGGLTLRVGISARGSPTMLCVMRYLSGRSARRGRTFLATGLYLRTTNVLTGLSELSVKSAHCSRVCKGSIDEEIESGAKADESDDDT